MPQLQKINLMPSLLKGMNPDRYNLDATGYATAIINFIISGKSLAYLNLGTFTEIEEAVDGDFDGLFPQIFHIGYIDDNIIVLVCTSTKFYYYTYSSNGTFISAQEVNPHLFETFVGGIFTPYNSVITPSGNSQWQSAVFTVQDNPYFAIVNGNGELFIKPASLALTDNAMIQVENFAPTTICQAQGCTWMGGFVTGLSATYLNNVKALFPEDQRDYLTLTAPSKTLLFVSSVGSDDLLYMWFPDQITEQSFRLVNRRQEQDWIDIPFIGEIMNIAPFKDGVLVYGKNGVAYVHREINPKRLVVQYVYDCGLLFRDTLGYCRDRHYFFDTNGALVKIDDKGVKKIGFESIQEDPTNCMFTYDVESDGFIIYFGYTEAYYISTLDAVTSLTTQFPKMLHNFNSCGLRLMSTYTEPGVGSTIPGASPEKSLFIMTETLIFDTLTTVRGIEIKSHIEYDSGYYQNWSVTVFYKVGLGCALRQTIISNDFLVNGYCQIDISCVEMSIAISTDRFELSGDLVIDGFTVYTETGGKLCLS